MGIHKKIIVFKQLVLAHKIVSVVALGLILSGGYYLKGKFFPAPAVNRYVLATAERGTLAVAISGSGQVSSSNQVDLKPGASGTILQVLKSSGSNVRAGELVVVLDSSDARKAVRDAVANLESARISLAKVKQPADTLSLTQAENALATAENSRQNAEDNLVKAYDDAFTSIASAFLNLPGLVTGLDSLVNGTAVNSSQGNVFAYHDLIRDINTNATVFRDAAIQSYNAARTAYDKNLQNYRSANRFSDRETIEVLLSETYETTKLISQGLKDMKNMLDLVNDSLANSALRAKPPAILSTHLNNAESYTNTANGNLSNLLNIKNTIQSNKETIASSARTILERTQALDKLRSGADPLDVRSQELAVAQRENALRDAEANLADYSVRAPFAGVLASVTARVRDSASAGSVLASLISSQKVAEISLNEVDVAKVKTGQKATLSFDALPDLILTGRVVEIDTLGTVSQGVVNYKVKIGLDSDDQRVRPGMSVSAAILVEVRQDVLYLPNSAVKTRGDRKYVEVLQSADNGNNAEPQVSGITSASPPKEVFVETGIANDTHTEIVGGLEAGEQVVSRTVSSPARTSSGTPPATTSFRIPGLSGGGLR